jgi:hypothetical protein
MIRIRGPCLPAACRQSFSGGTKAGSDSSATASIVTPGELGQDPRMGGTPAVFDAATGSIGTSYGRYSPGAAF